MHREYVRRLSVLVPELFVLEMCEEVLTNVFKRTVQRVGAPRCVRCWNNRCRLYTHA